MATENKRMRQRRGTYAERIAASDVPTAGELFVETDLSRLYVGDGTSTLATLPPWPRGTIDTWDPFKAYWRGEFALNTDRTIKYESLADQTGNNPETDTGTYWKPIEIYGDVTVNVGSASRFTSICDCLEWLNPARIAGDANVTIVLDAEVHTWDRQVTWTNDSGEQVTITGQDLVGGGRPTYTELDYYEVPTDTSSPGEWQTKRDDYLTTSESGFFTARDGRLSSSLSTCRGRWPSRIVSTVTTGPTFRIRNGQIGRLEKLMFEGDYTSTTQVLISMTQSSTIQIGVDCCIGNTGGTILSSNTGSYVDCRAILLGGKDYGVFSQQGEIWFRDDSLIAHCGVAIFGRNSTVNFLTGVPLATQGWDNWRHFDLDNCATDLTGAIWGFAWSHGLLDGGTSFWTGTLIQGCASAGFDLRGGTAYAEDTFVRGNGGNGVVVRSGNIHGTGGNALSLSANAFGGMWLISGGVDVSNASFDHNAGDGLFITSGLFNGLALFDLNQGQGMQINGGAVTLFGASAFTNNSGIPFTVHQGTLDCGNAAGSNNGIAFTAQGGFVINQAP